MRRSRLLPMPVLLALVALGFASTARADWPGDPLVNVPLCTATGSQQAPAVVSDGAGGAIVAWQDARDGACDIYAQRVSRTGVVEWTHDGVVLCAAVGEQLNPRMVADGTGGAIVVWLDERSGAPQIYAQRISLDGTALWTPDGVPVVAGVAAGKPDIASDGACGAIVTWLDGRDPPSDRIYAQRVSADGAILWAADGVPICASTTNTLEPSITADGAGGALITWGYKPSGFFNTYVLRVQRISPDGGLRWGGDGICIDEGSGLAPRTIADGAGGAITVWVTTCCLFTYRIVVAQIPANGAVDGGVLPEWLCDADGRRGNPGIVPVGAGGVIAAWEDGRGGETSRIYAQRSSAAGQWTPGGVVVCGAAGIQRAPAVVSDAGSGAIVTWLDERSGDPWIYAQRISAAGEGLWAADGVPMCSAAGSRESAAAVSDGAGGAIVAWQDGRNGDWDIYANAVEPTVPRRPSIQGIEHSASGWRLWWGRNRESDLDAYQLYRGSTPDFPLSPSTRIATLQDTSYTDASGTMESLYKITAVDLHGNESAPSCFTPGMPTPVLVSMVSASAAPDRVRIEWALAAGAAVDAIVYRSRAGEDWRSVGKASADGRGHLVHVDAAVSAGQRYGYRLGLVVEGAETRAGEVWVDVPAGELALEGVRPNPAGPGEATLCFTLPDASPARLEVLDVSGRVVSRREVGSLGPGTHALKLAASTQFAPGVYLVRLTTARQTLLKRAALLR